MVQFECILICKNLGIHHKTANIPPSTNVFPTENISLFSVRDCNTHCITYIIYIHCLTQLVGENNPFITLNHSKFSNYKLVEGKVWKIWSPKSLGYMNTEPLLLPIQMWTGARLVSICTGAVTMLIQAGNSLKSGKW